MRLKIILGNLAVVVLLGIAAYLVVGDQLRSGLAAKLDKNISNDRTLLERSYRLSAVEFLGMVEARAGTLSDVFGGLDESSRRTRAYEAAEATHAWLSDPARGRWGAPDLVVLTDETGKTLARNGARNVMYGKALLPLIPALRGTLQQGTAAHDLWRFDQEAKVLQTALAPIRNPGGAIVGALLVGYDLSNGVASREAALLDRDVAFIVDGKVYSTSLSGGRAKALQSSLFGALKAETNAILAGQRAVSSVWTTKVSGDTYVGMTARLPESPSLPAAYAVMGNRTEAVSLAGTANIILIMMFLGAVMVLAYGFVVGNGIMRAVEQMEEGVLSIINGRTDHRLETDNPDVGGLAYRINQLLNVFTGTEEASEDGNSIRVGASPGWQGGADAGVEEGPAQDSPAAGGGNGSDVIDDPDLATSLAAEDEAAYNARVYQEYVDAKQALGENVTNIPQERFAQRLLKRGEALADKHGCRTVRFQVHTRDNQVVLKPVLIR